MLALDACSNLKARRLFAAVILVSAPVLLVTWHLASPTWTRANPLQLDLTGLEFAGPRRPNVGPPLPEYLQSQTSKKEIRHVIFVKVHKAASSTVQSILLRFAISRELNVLLPQSGNILNNYEARLDSTVHHPKWCMACGTGTTGTACTGCGNGAAETGCTDCHKIPFLFDILCNHFIFNYTELQPYFPADTKYVAIVREPWSLIQSAYHYFTDIEPHPYLRNCNSFTQYLVNPLKFEPSNAVISYTMNRMSIDLGLPLGQLWNSSYSTTFINDLSKTFHLVLIADRFTESMVLMRRMFNWKTQDILFMKINQNKKKKTETRLYSNFYKSRLLHLNHHDVAVYGHFLSVFEQRVAAEGPDFKDEVASYSSMLDRLATFCSDNVHATRTVDSTLSTANSTLTFQATNWSEEFTLTISDCKLLSTKELDMVEFVRRKQLRRMYELERQLEDKNGTGR